MPAEQQSDASLRRQLSEPSAPGVADKAALLQVDRHAVERQHHREQIHRQLGSDGVAVEEHAIGREGEQRRAEGRPTVGHDLA